MEQIFSLFGPWTWLVAALVLLIVELLVAGIFAMWLALAALVVGLLSFVIDLSWQVELGLFSIISIALLVIARPIIRKRLQAETDRPNLNRRMHDYVGRSYVLDQPIVNGSGKLRIQDTTWRVSGPDLQAGKRVLVTGIDGMELRVEPVD